MAELDRAMSECRRRRLSEEDYQALIYARNATQHHLLRRWSLDLHEAWSCSSEMQTLRDVCSTTALLYSTSILFPLPGHLVWRSRLVQNLQQLLEHARTGGAEQDKRLTDMGHVHRRFDCLRLLGTKLLRAPALRTADANADHIRFSASTYPTRFHMVTQSLRNCFRIAKGEVEQPVRRIMVFPHSGQDNCNIFAAHFRHLRLSSDHDFLCLTLFHSILALPMIVATVSATARYHVCMRLLSSPSTTL